MAEVAGLEAHDVDVVVEEEVEAVAGPLEAAVAADARALLVAAGLEASELSVVLTSDEIIEGLNATWRGKAKPTDVLSFPQQEPPIAGGLLGDVVISVDTAARQAEAVGHDLARELRVLLAHGLCHLLGMDHELGEAEAAEMRAEEALLLAALAEASAPLTGRA